MTQKTLMTQFSWNLSNFENFWPPYWIRHLEFQKSNSRFMISDPKIPHRLIFTNIYHKQVVLLKNNRIAKKFWLEAAKLDTATFKFEKAHGEFWRLESMDAKNKQFEKIRLQLRCENIQQNFFIEISCFLLNKQ